MKFFICSEVSCDEDSKLVEFLKSISKLLKRIPDDLPIKLCHEKAALMCTNDTALCEHLLPSAHQLQPYGIISTPGLSLINKAGYLVTVECEKGGGTILIKHQIVYLVLFVLPCHGFFSLQNFY